jgi:hypothetical protein
VKTITPSLPDRAWAAGFFDGEGCVTSHKAKPNRRPRVDLQVAQVDRIPLDEFQRIVGCGNVNGPYTPKNPNAQPVFVWSVGGANGPRTVYDRLSVFLRSRKRQQLEEAIRGYDHWIHRSECDYGHPVKMNKSETGLYCPTCRSEAAYKRWETRRVAR